MDAFDNKFENPHSEYSSDKAFVMHFKNESKKTIDVSLSNLIFTIKDIISEGRDVELLLYYNGHSVTTGQTWGNLFSGITS